MDTNSKLTRWRSETISTVIILHFQFLLKHVKVKSLNIINYLNCLNNKIEPKKNFSFHLSRKKTFQTFVVFNSKFKKALKIDIVKSASSLNALHFD